ncbi:hypothetical protein GGR54DRAFT_166255 [Hypoxylon sp. NC1633]|nr:hypothetical protein GGR54DRAFT_166255 [Hypoxylon sp. NC1633]
MSADLFAAFEDSPNPPPSKGHPPRTFAQTSSLTSDPFTFGVNNSANSGSHIGSSQFQNAQQLSGTSSWAAVPLQSSQPSFQQQEDDDDGWGDFEVAPSTSQSLATSTAKVAPGPALSKQPQNPVLQRTRIVRASTIDLMTNNLLDLGDSSTARDEPRRPTWTQGLAQQVKNTTPNAAFSNAPKGTSDADPNVLFDADDFDGEQDDDDDDDFGEFETETVTSPAQPAQDYLSGSNLYSPPKTSMTRTSQMLSGLNLTEAASYPQAPRSPSFQDRNPFPGLVVAPPSEASKEPTNEPKISPATAWPSIDPEKSTGRDGFGDDWGAFENFPDEPDKSTANNPKGNWDWDSTEPTRPKPTNTQAPVTTSSLDNSSWDWDSVDAASEKQVDQSSKDDLPPTNIPPPSILLSVFPQLFEQANTSLYKPVSGQSFSVKNRILSDPKTIEFLKGYLALATVAARIIAGRKLRWHRDKFLAQRMTISAAGSKGMKLAGVDKAQAAREDREATDVVAHWKEHIGRLRSAIAAANSSVKNNTEQLKIPEVSESMQIQTEKIAPTAPKACIVCGLKRNERVSKVDHEVEDSFGEWWVDHWGHLACKRFWLQHENALRQR